MERAVKSKPYERMYTAVVDGILISGAGGFSSKLPSYLRPFVQRYERTNPQGPHFNPLDSYSATKDESDPRHAAANGMLRELRIRFALAEKAIQSDFDFADWKDKERAMMKERFGASPIREAIVEQRYRLPWVTAVVFRELLGSSTVKVGADARWAVSALKESLDDPQAADVVSEYLGSLHKSEDRSRRSIANEVKELEFEREMAIERIKKIRAEARRKSGIQKVAKEALRRLQVGFEERLERDLDPGACPHEFGTDDYFAWLRQLQDEGIPMSQDKEWYRVGVATGKIDPEDRLRVKSLISVAGTVDEFVRIAKSDTKYGPLIKRSKPGKAEREVAFKRVADRYGLKPRGIKIARLRARAAREEARQNIYDF